MDDLVRWLGEQLDEDDRIARGTGQPSLSWRNFDMDGELRDDVNAGTVAYVPREETRRHIARHDPARVLREIDTKRRTLVRCQEALLAANPMLVHFAKQTLREMALPFADRPGYAEAIASVE